MLKEQGHNVTAFYLKIWLEDELSFLGNCPWEEDLKYVQAICKQADVPLETIRSNAQTEYSEGAFVERTEALLVVYGRGFFRWEVHPARLPRTSPTRYNSPL